MNFKKFFRDKLNLIIFYLISTLLTILVISLDVFRIRKTVRMSSVIYALILSFVMILIYLVIDYLRKRKIYISLKKMRDTKDIGYIGSLPKARTNEDKLYGEAINSIYSNYEDEINKYGKREKLYRDFNNIWIHQMKTPISVMTLLLEDGLVSKEDQASLKEELAKLDNGLEIALYNLRLQDFKLDFKVEKVNLSEIARETINNNKNAFILNSIYPKVDIDEDLYISTDRKWIGFVFNQLVQNSIKYTRHKKVNKRELSIVSKEEGGDIELSFYDNGIGISPRDMSRVFQPFFTGDNGRISEESTGMGLYLTKIVLDRLGHRIDIESEEGEYTRVRLIFTREKSIYNI